METLHDTTTKDEPLPFNGLLFSAIQFISIFFIYPVASKSPTYLTLQLLIALFLAYACWHLIIYTTTYNPTADLALGSAILTQYMIALDAIFFTDPATTLRRASDPLGVITTKPVWEKLRWTVDYYTNPRGIGWAHEPSHLPSRPDASMTRSQFVVQRIFRAVLCVGLECVMYVMNASHPGTTTAGAMLSDAEWKYRAMGVLGFATAGFARINMLNCVTSALVVGAGLSSPQRWPNLFGSPLEGYTVQRVWRRVWHQILRKSLISCTTFITTKLLRFPPLSRKPSLLNTLHKCIMLIIAFIIIGFIHIGGDVMLMRRMCWSSFTFFSIQSIAIIGEKVVGEVWSKLGFSIYPKQRHNRTMSMKAGNGYASSTTANGRSGGQKGEPRPHLWIRLVGYIWVATWLVYSVAFMIDPLVSTGLFTDPTVDLRLHSVQDIAQNVLLVKKW